MKILERVGVGGASCKAQRVGREVNGQTCSQQGEEMGYKVNKYLLNACHVLSMWGG